MDNVIIIDTKDNVGVVVEWIKKDDDLEYTFNKEKHQIKSLDDIRIYHKVAIKDINKGDNIVKYGEHIGIASKDIKIGEHVHVHNVDDHREDLSKSE